MNDFRDACYAEAKDRGYSNEEAAKIADRASTETPVHNHVPSEADDAKSE